MPRNAAVYGKRHNPAGHFATVDFFASSSPRSSEDIGKVKADGETEVQEEDLNGVIAVLADQFLGLGVDDVSAEGSPENGVLSSSVLAERDGNASTIRVASKPWTKKNEKKVNTVSKQDEVSTANKKRRPRRVPSGDCLDRLKAENAVLPANGRLKQEINGRQASSRTRVAPSRRRSQSLPEYRSPNVTAPHIHTEPPSITNLDSTDFLKPLLSLCSGPTGSTVASSFAEWADSLSDYFSISKIAEASYGEVYRLSLKSFKAGFSKSDESVLKIIPLKPRDCSTLPPKYQSKYKWMSHVEDVANEVRLLQRMTDIPGFTNFRDIRVLQGRPPVQFAAAWRAWNKAQCREKKSQLPDPSRKTSYSESQLWAVIEMQDAGTDLEMSPCSDVWSAWDVFWGVAVALAKGEEEARFEHRDLHLGNICVRPTHLRKDSSSLLNLGVKVGYTGLETTIIDYTISRADMSDLSDIQEAGEASESVAYFDLSKEPAIFAGDATEEYQYDIYRYMQAAVFYDDPMTSNPPDDAFPGIEARSWRQYRPLSNLVWLHFLLYKISEQIEQWPSCQPEPAVDGSWEVAMILEERLGEMQSLLRVEELRNSELGCAADLVSWALQRQWLDVEDVVGQEVIHVVPQER